MQTCVYCGSEIDDKADFCKYCGIGKGEVVTQIVKSEPYSVLYFLGGLIIPLLGIVGYFYLRKTKQKQAKALGLGALLYFMFFGYGSIVFLVVSDSFQALMSV